MSEPTQPDEGKAERTAKHTAVEEFLQAVEKRTSDPIHRRLLAASRSENPTTSLDAELHKIVGEIINAA